MHDEHGSYLSIPLTKGQVAHVDECDYEAISSFKWCALWNPYTKSYYAWRSRNAAERVLVGGKKGTIYMHRQIMGEPRGVQIDHENHDTLNNRRYNLRIATVSQNQLNQRPRVNSSGIKGVSVCTRTGLWQAKFMMNGQHIWVGRFATKEEAGIAISAAMLRHCGQFSYRDGGMPFGDLNGATPGP